VSWKSSQAEACATGDALVQEGSSAKEAVYCKYRKKDVKKCEGNDVTNFEALRL
jgi:hypothetical protein